MKYMIVAYDDNRVIGGNNALPWQGAVPADLRHFKDMTIGKTIIMGRKTYESIGRPLPYRQNIVITHQDVNFDGVEVVHSLSHAYAAAQNEVVIIGGGEVYRLALNDVDVIFATEIHMVSGGDVTFPALDQEWVETDRENHSADGENQYDFSFVTYTKQR